MKPKRSDEGKGVGMPLTGPRGLGGKGSVSELRSAGCPVPLGTGGSSKSSPKPASPPQSAPDHLEEELDLLLNLDAPARAETILPDPTPQGLQAEIDGEVAQEETGVIFI